MLSGTSRMLPPSPKRLERDEAHTPQRSLAIDRVAQDDRLLADIQVLMVEQRGVMSVVTPTPMFALLLFDRPWAGLARDPSSTRQRRNT